MRIADTSALYASFVQGDRHHEESRGLFASAEPTVVPAEIFSETLGLLQLRVGFPAARDAGSAIRSTPHVRVEPTSAAFLVHAWDEYEAAAGRLSFADAVVVAWCLGATASAITFDKEIARRTRGR